MAKGPTPEARLHAALPGMSRLIDQFFGLITETRVCVLVDPDKPKHSRLVLRNEAGGFLLPTTARARALDGIREVRD